MYRTRVNIQLQNGLQDLICSCSNWACSPINPESQCWTGATVMYSSVQVSWLAAEAFVFSDYCPSPRALVGPFS